MIKIAGTSIIEPEILLEKMINTFDLRDTPVTQEMIDRCFYSISGKISDINGEYQELTNYIIGQFDQANTAIILFCFHQSGTQLVVNETRLRFPKFIIGYL